MGILVVIGRLLFVALFLVSAYGHLTRRKMMAGYAKSRGVPAAEFLVAATGVQMAGGSLMVALGVWPDLGALILFLFLIVTAFWMHSFWKESEPQNRAMERVQFYLALAGAALVMFAAFAALGPGINPGITGPLFTIR
ncbi:DoxX family protein [Arthrobacter globiformis]|uniref:DoxX family protein n=1 Tax=Arthrobacter globiformis TaxID=1665 RepID=UPI002780A0BA|nr:DoxX family protein [Arthrobacter globiformis]MDQ0864722.1 putative oxidoreductase [Arthrobacter globiformis]